MGAGGGVTADPAGIAGPGRGVDVGTAAEPPATTAVAPPLGGTLGGGMAAAAAPAAAAPPTAAPATPRLLSVGVARTPAGRTSRVFFSLATKSSLSFSALL